MRDLPADDRAVVRRFEGVGQGHVFRFIDRLEETERRALLDQTRGIDLDLLERQIRLASAPRSAPAGAMSPAVILRPAETDEATLREAREIGEDLLSRGAVAAVLVAGGQGTRLGWDGPKGAYPIGPVTNRTLFDWFAGRLRAFARRFGRPIPLYVMTSDATHDATVAFFRERNHIGLDPADVCFFRQGMVPAIDLENRLLLESPGRVFLGPDGHGGVFEGLADRGALPDMADRGVEEIFYFQVDNVLVRIADPVFLGFHHRAGAEMSSKVVQKSDPGEKVGVVARIGERLGVVEYSELTREQAQSRESDGRLTYGAGNIAIHAIRRDFAERVAGREDLPLHCAHKKVPYVDEGGTHVHPTTANAVKFEKFVFDALPLASRVVTMEVDRRQEFSPVKNASGKDSVVTARRDLTSLYLHCRERAGGGSDALTRAGVEFALEIDPVVALDGIELRLPIEENTP